MGKGGEEECLCRRGEVLAQNLHTTVQTEISKRGVEKEERIQIKAIQSLEEGEGDWISPVQI